MAQTNKIGTQLFLFMKGAPPVIQESVEAIDKPGRDMSTYRLQGAKCETFQIETLVDVTTQEAARNKLLTYAALKPTGALEFIKEGVTYVEADQPDAEDEIPLKVVVLDVKHVSTMVAGCMVGGLNVTNGSSGFLLRCSWTLRFVKVVP